MLDGLWSLPGSTELESLVVGVQETILKANTLSDFYVH